MTADRERWLDIHAHHYPDAYLDAICADVRTSLTRRESDGRRVISVEGRPYAAVPTPLPTVEERLAAMRAAGVSQQVISVPAPGFSFFEQRLRSSACAASNDELVAYARQAGGSLRVFLGVPLPDVAAAVAEVERWAVGGSVVAGLTVQSNLDELALDAPELADFWRRVDELATVVFVHPTSRACGYEDFALSMSVGFSNDLTLATARLLESGLVDATPRTTWVVAGGGGSVLQLVPRMSKYRAQFGTSASRPLEDQLRSLTFDTTGIEPSLLQYLMERHPGAWAFGSDYPQPLESIEQRRAAMTDALGSQELDRLGTMAAESLVLAARPR